MFLHLQTDSQAEALYCWISLWLFFVHLGIPDVAQDPSGYVVATIKKGYVPR